jgi:MFS family permease
LILLIVPSWPGILIAQLINGLAFGLYLSVDQALMTRVLPSMENAARDLGILNIANAGPQVLAPFVASMIIAAMGGYRMLFVVALFLVVLVCTLRTSYSFGALIFAVHTQLRKSKYMPVKILYTDEVSPFAI